MIARFALLAAALLALPSCATQFYGKKCAAAGVPVGTQYYADCVAKLRRQGQAQTLGDLGGAAAVGAAVYGASQPTTPLPQEGRMAPLIAQTVTGYQRACRYRAPTQVMTMTISSATSCPASIAY